MQLRIFVSAFFFLCLTTCASPFPWAHAPEGTAHSDNRYESLVVAEIAVSTQDPSVKLNPRSIQLAFIREDVPPSPGKIFFPSIPVHAPDNASRTSIDVPLVLEIAPGKYDLRSITVGTDVEGFLFFPDGNPEPRDTPILPFNVPAHSIVSLGKFEVVILGSGPVMKHRTGMWEESSKDYSYSIRRVNKSPEYAKLALTYVQRHLPSLFQRYKGNIVLVK